MASTFHLVNLGCKVNRVETDRVGAALLSQGYVLAPQNKADLIFINTCTVTAQADKKARKAVRHALRANPNARVVVSGCATAIDPDFYDNLDERVLILTRPDIEEKIAELDPFDLLRFGEGFQTRVSLKVQDGCDNACTYCIVHVARGAARSKPVSQIEKEVEAYVKAGAREFVLTGINIGSYQAADVSLDRLLTRLLEITEPAKHEGTFIRFRISSIEPQDVSKELIDVVAHSEGRVCAHFHLPLQAGSDRVLHEMDRAYSSLEFTDLVDAIYESMPHASISTDIICGFPGETDDDFNETLSVARHCRFSKIHVFPYSMRENTPAADRSDQCSPEIKRKRVQALQDLNRTLRRDDLMRRVGTVEYALVEEHYATTESYHEVKIPIGAKTGDLIPVEISTSDLT